MKKALIISIFINNIFVLLGGYIIYRKGGIEFLKMQFYRETETANQHSYDPYYEAKKSIFEIMPNDTNEIIFLGNSITDYCEWHELFGKANIKNRGINGDIINGVIERLDEIVASKPKKIFLMIGINNLSKKNSVQQILIDYERLLLLIKQKSPQTKLFVQSILPTYNQANLQIVDILALNVGLKNLTKKHHLTYINLFDLLKNKENKLENAYTFDGLHLNGQGYLIWKKAIENYVNN